MRTRVAGLLALAGVAVALAAPGALAASSHLAGGGTASVGELAFSQVAINVAFGESGSASGSFNCLMAGRSAFVLGAFNLAHIMKVQATPAMGSVSGSIATFSGPGFLIMDGGQRMNIDVSVWVNVATQEFQLTVAQVGAMPVETFASGGVSLR